MSGRGPASPGWAIEAVGTTGTEWVANAKAGHHISDEHRQANRNLGGLEGLLPTAAVAAGMK